MSLKIVLGDTKKVELSCPRSQMNRIKLRDIDPTELGTSLERLCD